MPAWWSGTGLDLLRTPDGAIVAALAHRALGRHRVNEHAQLRAWSEQVRLLKVTCRGFENPAELRILFEFEIPRLGGRIDAVILLPRAIVAIEFKVGAERFDPADTEQLRGYALDLQDFHAGSRRHPILPVLVATNAQRPHAIVPILLPGAAPFLQANGETLPGLVRDLAAAPSLTVSLPDHAGWEHESYRPVPNIVDAACHLFLRHDVADLLNTRAGAQNLSITADRIATLLNAHRQAGTKLVCFVTGIPGAGKTLCGLNAAFAGDDTMRAAFLTGNPSLVHVLREALVRSVASTAAERRAARHRMESVIQALPRFRDHGVRSGDTPPERVVVIDEAQRSWTETHAVSRTRDKPVPLDRSEPAHLLDIMARHQGFCAILCLIGNGQEIHDGEGGMAAWSEALAQRPDWFVAAAGAALEAPEPRNRLARLPGLSIEPSLHLDVPVRALRHDATPRWVDCVLRGDAEAASAVVRESGPVPFRLTRDLAALRAGLRARARDQHRAGLIASAGARRLRAEGLGCEVPHMDAEAVARWFLDSWVRDRDVRASDALELVATQFSVQGLELDQVGLCWGGDLVRNNGGWEVRSFRGTRWQTARDADKIAWRLNTYRVLLTRARFDTLIWVPRGDAADPTRDPARLDAVAAFLRACGVTELETETIRPSETEPYLIPS
ncbi:DUF2075 domain-containing protein [Acetobacteraceae bacterium KSS8]|uniref:DUF2075 domain-containing protein n=1 Tax=Endosaccharibacter trunci TaxID=2812733 RepID=A0ABT1W8J6_9PROT|nr:DUF2075 domain-containing protein [Acetobacteraceae bacterium KSS8]